MKLVLVPFYKKQYLAVLYAFRKIYMPTTTPKVIYLIGNMFQDMLLPHITSEG